MESVSEASVAYKRRNIEQREEAPLQLPLLFSAAGSSPETNQESIKKSLHSPTGKASLSDLGSQKLPGESNDQKTKKMASFPTSGENEEDCNEKLVGCSSSSRGDEKDLKNGDGANSSLSEVGKKRLLAEIGVGQTSRGGNLVQIRVIDGTMLIECADPLCQSISGRPNKQEESRRPRKADEKYQKERKCRASYSRKEMESLRFAKVVEQRKLWCEVYARLGGAVRREYEGLSMQKHCKNFRQKFDPTAPAILGRYCAGAGGRGGARQPLDVFVR